MKMLRVDTLMIVATLLLLVVNWFAFHDFREPRTGRDWLMLLASIMVIFEFAREFWKENFGHD